MFEVNSWPRLLLMFHHRKGMLVGSSGKLQFFVNKVEIGSHMLSQPCTVFWTFQACWEVSHSTKTHKSTSLWWATLLMDPKTQQFLLGPENRPSTPKYPSTKSPKRSGTYLCSIRVQILVHVFLVLLYTLASFAVIQKNKLETSKRSSHAPQGLLSCYAYPSGL
jgi:hypothetical protein